MLQMTTVAACGRGQGGGAAGGRASSDGITLEDLARHDSGDAQAKRRKVTTESGAGVKIQGAPEQLLGIYARTGAFNLAVLQHRQLLPRRHLAAATRIYPACIMRAASVARTSGGTESAFEQFRIRIEEWSKD